MAETTNNAGHESPVKSVAVAESAGIIISGSWDNTIKLWELRTGWLLNTLYHLPEGEWAAVSGDNEIISTNANRYACMGVNPTNFPAWAMVTL